MARFQDYAPDHHSLAVMTEAVKQECGAYPTAVLADCGYHLTEQIAVLEGLDVETYVPDACLARELANGRPAGQMNKRQRRRGPGLHERCKRLRGPTGRTAMSRRKALVESVFGVLKQQRGMRRFRRRGLAAVSVEWTLATTAYNLTRLYNRRRAVTS